MSSDSEVPLDRAQLASVPWTRIHSARSWTQATIWGLEWEGRRLAVKDFAGRGWITRLLVGRWTIRKEARVYRRLRHVGGVPRCHGRIAGPALVLEWLPIKRLPKAREGKLTPALFDELDRILAEIHGAGIAHGDVRRKNIAIGEDGHPRLIDFTTAVARPGLRLWPLTALFRVICLSDLITALRIRRSFFPDDPITAEQQALLDSEPFLLKLGRWYRQRLYRPFKKRVLRR